MSEQVLHLRIAIRRSDLKDKAIDVNRLQKKIDRIIIAIRSAVEPILYKFGDEILAMARHNAATYYEAQGATFTGNRREPFKPRHPATEELYEESPYHTATAGLSAGYDRIIESLFPDGYLNIHNLVDGNQGIEVGTANPLSKVIEEGLPRLARPHVGQGKKRPYLPWRAILEKHGVDPDNPPDLPPRPFLKPALWHLRDEEDGKFLYGLMVEIIKRVIGGMQIGGVEVEAA